MNRLLKTAIQAGLLAGTIDIGAASAINMADPAVFGVIVAFMAQRVPR